MICTQSHTARKGRSWGVKAGLSDSSGSSPSWDRGSSSGRQVRRPWCGPGRGDGGLDREGVLEEMRSKWRVTLTGAWRCQESGVGCQQVEGKLAVLICSRRVMMGRKVSHHQASGSGSRQVGGA